MAEEQTVAAEHPKTSMTGGEKVRTWRFSRYSAYAPRRHHVASFVVTFLLLAGLIALIVWLVYRPNDPHYVVVGAAIYDLNSTSTTTISSTMQFTVLTRNPNKRTGIYYDRLSTYVQYRNQQITLPVTLPPFYHDSKSTVALSPILGGGFVPVSMDVANGLVMDQTQGVVRLRLMFVGTIRYKAGSIKTGHQDLITKCDLMVGLPNRFAGQVSLLGSPECDVDT